MHRQASKIQLGYLAKLRLTSRKNWRDSKNFFMFWLVKLIDVCYLLGKQVERLVKPCWSTMFKVILVSSALLSDTALINGSTI
jgi:hypothetical protein